MGQIEFGSSINVNKVVCGTTCILTPVFIENGTCLASKYAPISHTHGNVNNGGCIGSVSGCLLATTTSGCITTIPSTTYQTALVCPITGNGSSGYVPMFTGVTAIGSSPIYVVSATKRVGIGTTNPTNSTGCGMSLHLYDNCACSYPMIIAEADSCFGGAFFKQFNDLSCALTFGTFGSANGLAAVGGVCRPNNSFIYSNNELVLNTQSAYPMTFATNNAARLKLLTGGTIQFNNYGTGANTGTPAYTLNVNAGGCIIEDAVTNGTVTSVTAGNGMTQSGTASINPTLDVVSATGTAGSVGLVVVAADSIGVCLGTGSCHASRGDHAHGNINNSGCIGSASGCVVCTTTSGCLTTFTLPAYTTCTGTVTSVAVNSPLTGSTITTSGTFGIQKASASQDGYLSCADWITFNSKTSCTGTVTAVCVAAGNGLTGGANITTSGTATLNVASNAGSAGSVGLIVVNADDIGVCLGTGSCHASRGDHAHGCITTGGCVGSASGCVLCTTTSGCVTVFTLPAYTTCTGTVTSVAVNSPLTGSTITSSGTFGIQKASASQNGYLSCADWTTFNSKTSCTGTVTCFCNVTHSTAGTDITSSVANATTTPTLTLCIPTASASARGLLSCADWSTFNGKTSCTGTVTSVAVNSPLTGSTVTTSGTFGIQKATSGQNGYLSSADWTTFNSKTTCTGTVTSVTVTAGNGLTGGGTVTTSGTATLNVASHAGTAGSIGLVVIGTDDIGVCLGTGSCHASRGDHAHGCITTGGCMSGGVSGCVLCTTTNGCITYGTITGGGITSANNGLHVAGTNVHLGGALTGNTVLSGGYSVSMPIVCSTGTTCVGTNIHMTTGTGRNICFGSISATVGASLNVAAQTGAANQVGGVIYICGGCAGTGTAIGGAACVVGGCGTSAAGGTASLIGGTGSNGGNVYVVGGGSAGTGGHTYICGGAGGSSAGGSVNICAGGGGSVGQVCIYSATNLKLNTTTAGVLVTGCLDTTTCMDVGTCLLVGTDIALATGVAHNIFPTCSTSVASTFCICGQGYQGTSSAGTGGAMVIAGGPSYASISTTAFGGSLTLIGGYACNGGAGQPATGGFTYLCGGCGVTTAGGTATGGGVYIVGGVGAGGCGTVYIMNGGTYALCALPASCVALNYSNSLRFATTSAGGTLTGIFCATTCGTSADWVATSDCRVKKDIQPISNALSMIMELQGVCYHLCDDCDCGNHIGLIAQDVEKILPDLVAHGVPTEDDAKYGITDDKLGLKYDKLTAVLIEAIKEQQVQINNLTAELDYIKFINKV